MVEFRPLFIRYNILLSAYRSAIHKAACLERIVFSSPHSQKISMAARMERISSDQSVVVLCIRLLMINKQHQLDFQFDEERKKQLDRRGP